ncbi:hypothetical protein DXH95_15145 [Sphingorhabdus pulchriflava]|uniref:LPXTG-motif cell wall anchor domain-containing protein n=1 Tax=Sphingorhabdus pulchriflava TaxID=2292257 RepID=A0A371B241_9SPHN|nr:hypothetical protein [Sphingorhabdus pulchriflava]RDV01620.1 hypothetical protein DXH95_15145 [Sphingorhabdus pulchriflava]
MTKRFKGWAMVFAAAVMSSSVAYAQDSGSGQDIGTGMPPELRDFRLDTPPPRPAPQQSAPPPVVETPPPTERSSPTTQPSEQRPTVSRPTATNSSSAPVAQGPSEATTETGTKPAPVATGEPVIAPERAVPATAVDAYSSPPANSVPLDAPSTILSRPWFWPAIAGFAAILAAAAWIFFRRRQRSAYQQQVAVQEPVPQPSPPPRLDTSRKTQPPALPRTPERTAEAAGPVAAQFTPTSAQLSIASLSVTGILAIKNQTRTPVSGLILRSHMISAQDGQREAVAAFHSDGGAGSIQPIGDLAPGERIEATIEIRLPRTELSSFRWTEREFVAPIVLIHLSGSAEGEPIEIQFTQLIGREGAKQSERMQPLPIDRGPKRFSGIAARAVFA